ncbi:hypothetical protein H1230_16615 [Paenibacillus sp. 19GGS1-52]|uniref:hypothetical protein n=1 Tax=Paenibacillus sp. 19GGS1-52 TaxID=2758563 RepID=UPI001EFB58EE|nr:hypothetical protein [Paenibacillus sp. 19GGS1-52]ULO04780.1 hypothetical protein H1230_16615 [Paenibacillus sp. 19GGS1-52]
MGTLAINKTGTSHNVEDYNFNLTGGKILANEVFAITGTHPGNPYQYQAIRYRNSSGALATGYLFIDGFPALISNFSPVSTSSFYDYSTGGYSTFGIWNVRRSTNVYGPDGVSIHAVVNSGGQVAGPLDAQTGQSHPDWLLVKYFKQSGGSWIPMYQQTGGATPNGFAPIGLEYGSTMSTLSIYGV